MGDEKKRPTDIWNERDVRVVFFGDSICVGQGVSIHRGWVTRISALLEKISNEVGKELVIVNASVNGNTTREALGRIAYEVQNHGVQFMLVQFGMNDCNYWDSDNGLPRVSPNAFRANLQEIIDRGRTFGAERIMLNTNHPTTRTKKTMAGGEVTYQQSNGRYNQIIRDVAAEAGSDLILNDIERVFFEKLKDDPAPLSDYLLPDELHLSRKGHDLYFETSSAIVEQLVRELV